MSEGTAIIQKSLQRIGKHSVAKPAAPESIEVGRDMLNSMLEVWKSNYIDLGTMPLDAPGDELSEPVDARNAIIDNLAVYFAPDFSAEVTRELRKAALEGLADVKKHYQVIPIPKKKVSSTMPLGAGATRFIEQGVFAGDDFEIDA